MDYSSWGCKESDMTEATKHAHTHCLVHFTTLSTRSKFPWWPVDLFLLPALTPPTCIPKEKSMAHFLLFCYLLEKLKYLCYGLVVVKSPRTSNAGNPSQAISFFPI